MALHIKTSLSFLPLAIFLICGFWTCPGRAISDAECFVKYNCGTSTARAPNPSNASQIKINPSAVPTEKGYGIETIFYKGEYDFGLVRGTGRVGAALSPSNTENTFFGAPGFESSDSLLLRKTESEKYPNQKLNLAAAMNLVDKKGQGFGRYSLNVGVMAKYNKLTHGVTPGAGVNGVLGAMRFGYSIYNDQAQIEQPDPTMESLRFSYQVQTYNVGLNLSSLNLDYSHLWMTLDSTDPITVDIYSASLTVSRFIFTAAQRFENSVIPNYNYQTRLLEDRKDKIETFGGIQYVASANIVVGALYNYYLLREIAGTVSIFF